MPNTHGMLCHGEMQPNWTDDMETAVVVQQLKKRENRVSQNVRFFKKVAISIMETKNV